MKDENAIPIRSLPTHNSQLTTPNMKHYYTLVLGHLSKDVIVTPEQEESMIGGAVVYSSVTARRIGANVAALTKLNADDLSALDVFATHGVPVIHRASRQTTSIRNTYLTADRERRTCEAISIADPFELNDIPEDVTAGVYYMGGLIRGEFPEELVRALSGRGKTAVDVQGYLRVARGGPMVFEDWDRKREIIPLIHFLKTDAAEAEILTGEQDCEEAARILHGWGADEVMVTRNAGVVVCVGGRIHTSPFTSRNLSGRTGRGDTCFCTYCTWRKDHAPDESCLFAAALTSLKMETPGPFSKTVADVQAAIAERY